MESEDYQTLHRVASTSPVFPVPAQTENLRDGRYIKPNCSKNNTH
jgi:hypothetical protein